MYTYKYIFMGDALVQMSWAGDRAGQHVGPTQGPPITDEVGGLKNPNRTSPYIKFQVNPIILTLIRGPQV